ncbi:cytohesin-3-like isoform X1 [Convolutriloba macropyga]|uniref:cytohesin-3-like isoform X1 n=1 Tax=Convolutriloba macropyga TaxID=536237 RepID=UPI003F51B0B7
MNKNPENLLAQKREEKIEILQDLQRIQQELDKIDEGIDELQLAVDTKSEASIFAPAVQAFNGGFFSDCFQKLKDVEFFKDETSAFERAQFIKSKMHNLKVEMVHKYLFKPESREVLKEFIISVDIWNLSLLESMQKCFEQLKFSSAEAQVITFIYQCISKSYFLQNHDMANQIFGNEDVCEFVAGAIMFINTSFHNPNVRHKMTEKLFAEIGHAPEVKCMSASGVSREYMINLYREIKEKPLRFNSKLEETLEDRVLMRGYLYMQRGNWRTWTKRYFVLHSNQLCYYENEDSLQPRGVIMLNNVNVAERQHRKWYCFDLFNLDGRPLIVTKTRRKDTQTDASHHTRYILAAERAEQKLQWLAALRSILKLDLTHALTRSFSESQAPSEDRPTTPDPRRRVFSEASAVRQFSCEDID